MIDTSTPSDDTAGLVHFPDMIETAEDTPVLLTTLLAPELGAMPIDALTISCINDVPVEAIDSHDLPGIRIGSGTGCGYIVRRPFDAQLLFVPDAGFSGLTFFRYTIADAQGEEATLVATISVRPEPEVEPESARLSFAHGIQKVSLPVGVGAAILGALTIDAANPGSSVDISVYEGDQTSQSHRFDVQNGTLRLTQPLNDDAGVGIIKLSVVAVADDKVIGRCEVDVEIAAGGSDQFEFTETCSPSQNTEDRSFIAIELLDDKDVLYESRGVSTRECAAPEGQPQPASNVVRPQSPEDDPFGG